MNHGRLLALLGVSLVVLGIFERGWFFILSWLGLNFLQLATAHARGNQHVFGKRPDGTIPWFSCLMFLPLLLMTIAVWHLIRWISREPAFNVVNENLTIGRRILPKECPDTFSNFVDLTAEFSEPAKLRKREGYVGFPILDGAAPTADSLFHAINSLKPGKTFVHCAQGHGRTAMFAAALLISSGKASSIEQALQHLLAVRPGIRLSQQQLDCLNKFAELQSP